MNMRLKLDQLIGNVYIGYLELVAKTSKIEVEFLDKVDVKNCILGFYHGDSYVMNLLMRALKEEELKASIVVTADARGNYIEKLLNYYNMKALRMPDGIRMKSFLRELKEESKKENETLVVSLDGPLGPLHEPKKIGFMLSNYSQKEFLGVKLEVTRKIRLTKRWDNYIIPLPFSKIKFTISNFGVVSKENLADFNNYKELVKIKLM
ncbi:MAG: hypothetical protein RR894_14460 [Terrisporobacter sp.]